MTLDEFRDRLAAGGKPKDLSKLIGELPEADRAEAGQLFGEYKTSYVKPTQPVTVKIERKFLWSMIGHREIVMREGELTIRVPGPDGFTIVVTGDNMKVKT